MNRTRENWPASVIGLHWAGAAVIITLIALGVAMRRLDLPAAEVFDLYQWHKSFGFLALVLVVAHLCASAAAGGARTRAKGRERRLALGVQAALHVAPLAAILAGWLLVSASPIPVPTRVFGLFVAPNLCGPSPRLFEIARLAHAGAAYAILALTALHVAGALKHHLRDRDDTLSRMWGGPPRT